MSSYATMKQRDTRRKTGNEGAVFRASTVQERITSVGNKWRESTGTRPCNLKNFREFARNCILREISS
ncbi:hypothetical protein Y032_0015g2630 [Ancylostoma ceylanicum]|uniref:Uncharacterized protein n=1 Tax=Ancylostoma ceylanicum TaxID=53326 RepID=A0A016V6V5_9BILA|nr:hypothetical protein Y032_0015g2630 [Ancylostoma ceylanicum]